MYVYKEINMLQKNVLEYLESSARRFPDKIAYADETGGITFSELLLEAKRIGTKISKEVQATGKPIGVVTGRNYKCLTAYFGVLYSGNCYVPIDSEMPEKRLETIFSNLQPELLLYNQIDEKVMSKFSGTKTMLYGDTEEIDEEALVLRRSKVLDIDPVYIIYTSGSTGVPKGIVISHRAVIDFIEWMAESIGYVSEDVFANQAPFYFDCSVKDLYLTLKLGATDYIIPKKFFMFPTMLIDYLNENKVTSLTWATSGFNLVSSSGILEKKKPEYLNKVAIGGEAMLAKHLNNWRKALPEVKFVNLYGPTEVTVDCTWFEVKGEYEDHEAIPIGKACANKEVMLLDGDLNPVPVGEAGEICVRGIGLAHGYYNDAEKTDAAFVRNPNVPYIDYIYRTGDIGIMKEDGNIVFQSRKDGQIKHMGYRIELGEIERAVNALDYIVSAICFYDSVKGRIVCTYEGEADSKQIARDLGKLLPKYMIPNIYRKVDKMPFNANSKIDRVLLRKEYEDEKDN